MHTLPYIYTHTQIHTHTYIYIYLAASGLSCEVWDLQLWHAGFSSLTRDRTQPPCIVSVES